MHGRIWNRPTVARSLKSAFRGIKQPVPGRGCATAGRLVDLDVNRILHDPAYIPDRADGERACHRRRARIPGCHDGRIHILSYLGPDESYGVRTRTHRSPFVVA